MNMSVCSENDTSFQNGIRLFNDKDEDLECVR